MSKPIRHTLALLLGAFAFAATPAVAHHKPWHHHGPGNNNNSQSQQQNQQQGQTQSQRQCILPCDINISILSGGGGTSLGL